MTDAIYKQQLIDRYQSPRHRGEMTNPSFAATVVNPLCGDRLQVQILTKHNRICEVRWQGDGCAISLTAADLLAEHILNQEIEQVMQWSKADIFDLLGTELKPSREKCALLSLDGLKQALTETNTN